MVEDHSEITKFYDDKSVFITGGTGFMGKVLVEKLLRSCLGIKTIYLLMRSSNGKNVQLRLEELINNQAFERIHPGHVLNKLVALEGDVSLPNFGLSINDLQLLIDNVSIVFHSAATVRFDQDLKTAMEMNVEGPRSMLKICKQMKHLKALVHVSTAYIKPDEDLLDEMIYETTTDPDILMTFLDSIHDMDQINQLYPDLLGYCTNTYNFTKGLAEWVLHKERDRIPLAIVRPSIVTAAYREPFPGWIDNFNGPTGLAAGIGQGVVRVLKADPKVIHDIVPVDMAINLMVAVAWETATKYDEVKLGEIPVYNFSSGEKNPVKNLWVLDKIVYWWTKKPCHRIMWIPSAILITNEVWFRINSFFLHLIPAYFFNFVGLFNSSSKKKIDWVGVYEKLYKGVRLVEPFVMRQWNFTSHRPYELIDRMARLDQSIFFFDIRKVNWEEWTKNYVAGMRVFLLKDPLDTIEKSKVSLNRMYLIRLFFRLSFIVLLFVMLGAFIYCFYSLI